MPEFTAKLFAPAGEECIIKRASTYEYFLSECRPSRRGAADRVASKVARVWDFWRERGEYIYMSMGNFEGGVRALLCALGVRAAGRRGSARLGSSECYENNGSQKPLGTGRTSL